MKGNLGEGGEGPSKKDGVGWLETDGEREYETGITSVPDR